MADVKISELTALTSPDGAEELVVNDGGTTKKITITNATSASLSKTGGTMTGDTFHGNNVAARFGAGNDLSINHTGSYSSIVDSGTGDLWIAADANVNIANAALNEYKAQFISNGAVNLYHNNVAKFSTTATGVAITGGIAIGGTGAANTLDDYEEGTWTATATNVAATISNTTYTKIGRVVYVTGHLVCTANATGDVTINGLPYAQKPSSNGIGTCMNYLVNVAGGSTYNFSTYLSGSGLRFYRSEDNSAWLWAGASSLYNGAQILFNLTYQTT